MEWLYFLKVSFLPEGIVNTDKALFRKLNGEWHNGFLDAVVPFIREPFFWMPFYLFLILFVLINFRTRGLLWVLFALCLVGITDYMNSSGIKEIFFRLRPCADPDMAHTLRLLVKRCPGSWSFPSSHAVNHFAVATFIFVTFRNAVSRQWGFIFLWAAAVCYAQVYVGVHYPVDVFCGAIVGIILGYIVSMLYNRAAGLEIKVKNQV